MSSARAQLIGKSQNVCLSAAALTSLHTYSCGLASVWSVKPECERSRNVKCCKSVTWHFDYPHKNTGCRSASSALRYIRAMQATWLRGWKRYFEHFVSYTFSPDGKWPRLTDGYDIFEKMMHPNVFGDLMPLICTLRDRHLPLKFVVLLAIT